MPYSRDHTRRCSWRRRALRTAGSGYDGGLGLGGPPLLTHDPDTPGPRHWEINLSAFREWSRHSRLSETPRLDVNYGVGRRLQLKVEAPYLAKEEDGAHAV